MLRSAVMVLGAFLATSSVCSAQIGSVDSIDRELRQKAETGQFSGSILIAKGERTLLSKGYGLAAYPDGVANTSATRFRIGSLTKQFTAAAILELRDEGRLSLDDLVCSYVHPCPPSWAEIKLSHLLSHTSGIPGYGAIPKYDELKASPISTAQLLARIQALPLEFAPGTAFGYGDSSYAVLGAVIEQVSGTSYAGFLRAKILDPLGMAETACDNLPASEPGARGYVRTARGLAPAPVVDASVAFSSAGMYSTTQDLLRWARALMRGSILSDRSRREMFTPGLEDFGYGWIVPRQASPATYLHLGALAGFESAIFVLPELQATAIVLSNVEGIDVQSLAASSVITGAYAEYEGEYSLRDLRKTMRVFQKTGTLRAQTTRGPMLLLEYVSGDEFVALRGTESEVHIAFSRDDSGQIVGVQAEQFGKKFSGTRRPAPGTNTRMTPRRERRLANAAAPAFQNTIR